MESQYQILPPLSDEEYETLKQDIATRGVQVPVELDDQGNILDGHHRVRICQELGIKDYPTIIRVGLSEGEKVEHALALNLARRHLTREQRRELVARLRQQGWSTRRIAEMVGVSQPTVLNDLSADKNLSPDLPDRVIGEDGKHYPARKPKKVVSVIAKGAQDTQKALSALDDMDTEELPRKVLDTRRIARLAREQQARKRAAECADGDVTSANVMLLQGDMRERGAEIPDESVDLIFTDPPYPREYLPLWSDLSALAARILKPDGVLVAYTGAMFLPEILNRLSEHLEYWWSGAVVLSGPHMRTYARKVQQGVKPLLFFVRPGGEMPNWFYDTYTSEERQKDLHDWQQSLGAALYFIKTLTPTNGVVVDPFLGAGTTGVAAVRLGRSFIGIEVEKAAFSAAKERINGEIK